MKKRKGAVIRYLILPCFLAIWLVLVDILMWRVCGSTAGIIGVIGIAVYLTAALILYFRMYPQILQDFTLYAEQYDTIQNRMISQMTIPYAVLDTYGYLITVNDAFASLTECRGRKALRIDSLFPELDQPALEKLIHHTEDCLKTIPYGGRILRVQMEPISIQNLENVPSYMENFSSSDMLISLYLYDETENITLKQEKEEDKPVVGLVYVDNYEEASESVEEVRRALLMALVDRQITKYFTDYDAVVRKTEKDKYFVVLKNSTLVKMKEERFPILDGIKGVSIGNKMPVTISIGLGLGTRSFRQDGDYARIAMEMALGRGGDQAVIKDGDTISYYGGKSLQIEKSTRVKARVKAQALKEYMSSKDKVVCMGHKITDVDALGAAIGIYRAGQTIGKPVYIVVNDPTTSIRPLIDGFLENSEYQKEIFIDSTRAIELVDEDTAVVVVDTNKPSYTECPQLLHRTKTVIVLDHHRRGNEVIENAILSYVEPFASSACEMVAEILQYFSEDLKLRNLEADCLYAGIVVDTNNFVTRAGVRTFEAAAYLRRNGADTTRVRKLLRDNIDSYRAKAEAVRTAEIYREFFAIGQCPSDGLESPTVVGAQAANELLNIAGVKASFVLTQFKDEIYVSARAIDEVNVQVMMEQLGGGGHLNIAGAQVKTSAEETKQMLRRIIDQFLEEGGLKP